MLSAITGGVLVSVVASGALGEGALGFDDGTTAMSDQQVSDTIFHLKCSANF